MYRWWQAADRDPSGREVLVDVSVYCSVWRGKVREKEREQNDSRTSSVSDDSVKKKHKADCEIHHEGGVISQAAQ